MSKLFLGSVLFLHNVLICRGEPSISHMHLSSSLLRCCEEILRHNEQEPNIWHPSGTQLRRPLYHGEQSLNFWRSLGFTGAKASLHVTFPILAFHHGEDSRFKGIINMNKGHFFYVHFIFWFSSLPKANPSKQDYSLISSFMAPKKIVPEKRKRTELSSRVPLPPLEKPEKFITLEAEKLYHESLYNRNFFIERGFPNSNVCFNFLIQEKGWTKFCEHPPPRIASVLGSFTPTFDTGWTPSLCTREVGGFQCCSDKQSIQSS